MSHNRANKYLSWNRFYNSRFPNQNQTRNCWQNYVDFHRCQKIKVWNSKRLYEFIWSTHRVRNTSLASSLPRTFRQSAPMLGLRSGMSRGRRLESKIIYPATFCCKKLCINFLRKLHSEIFFVFSERLPCQHLNCDAPHHAEQLEFRTKNYLLRNLLCKCETDFRFPLEKQTW